VAVALADNICVFGINQLPPLDLFFWRFSACILLFFQANICISGNFANSF